MVDHIGHNDRLCDLHYNRSVAVTEFVLLIPEHLSNRIVSDVKENPCWVSMFDETANIAANVLSIPLATNWPEQGFATLCRVKTKQRNRLFEVTLNALINVSINGPESLQSMALRLCCGA